VIVLFGDERHADAGLVECFRQFLFVVCLVVLS
jgi:hypothetical protein